MKKTWFTFKDSLITIIILCLSFVLSLILQRLLKIESFVTDIFILGVFLTSTLTQGYIYGLLSSLISVLAVNFAFTFPYFKINFTMKENLISAVIMIIIALVTCGFTARFKHSEAIKAEGEREKMRANLLRAISHDLRTPLTAIYGASSALLANKNTISEAQKDTMLQGIKDDSQWLSRLVENLLSITKLDNGNVKLIKTPIVLDELVDSVLIKFKKRYPEQKVDINIPSEFIMIPMDAILIEQVLINILENAVQHAVGMTKLSLEVYTLSDKAIFEIKDDGCGISEDKLKSIFTGGYTAAASASDSNRNNAGIGLSVCATIIKAHGGDIAAMNRKSGGSIFRFILDIEGDTSGKQ